MSKAKCILCEKDAIVESARKEGKTMDAIFVDCETCKKYYLDAPDMFRQEEMPREKRAMLSAYTRERFELGEEPPEIGGPDTLEEIITEYDNKTEDEKIENLIWYVRKKSREYDDKVPWDAEKDYPITYSYGPEGFEEMRKIARDDKGWIQPPAKGIEFRLTEEGFKLGTKLLESKKKK